MNTKKIKYDRITMVRRMILENINKKVLELSNQAQVDLKDIFEEIDDICLHNSNRILSAFIENRVEYDEQTIFIGHMTIQGALLNDWLIEDKEVFINASIFLFW